MRMKFKFKGTSYQGWGQGIKLSVKEDSQNDYLTDTTSESHTVGLQFMLL